MKLVSLCVFILILGILSICLVSWHAQAGNSKINEINVRHNKEIRWIARLLHKQASDLEPNYMLKLIVDSEESYRLGDLLYEEGNLKALLDVFQTLKALGSRPKPSFETSIELANNPDDAADELAFDELLRKNVSHILKVLFKRGKDQFMILNRFEKPKMADWKFELFSYLREYALKKGYIRFDE